jgi:hypothetical protein
LGTKTRAVVVAYTNTKKVAIGCLTIHDLSGRDTRGPNIGSWLSHDRYSPRQRHMRREDRVIQSWPRGTVTIACGQSTTCSFPVGTKHKRSSNSSVSAFTVGGTGSA